MSEVRDVITTETGQAGSGRVAVNGAPIGTYLLSTRLETYLLSTRLETSAALVDLQLKLAQCEPYQKLAAESGDLWEGPTETQFGRALATAGGIGEQPNPFMSITQATMAGGHLADAMAWSGKVLEHVHNETGMSGMLANSEAGNMFGVYWMFGADSAADAETAGDALLADAVYITLLDEAGDLFIQGSAQRMLMMRLP